MWVLSRDGIIWRRLHHVALYLRRCGAARRVAHQSTISGRHRHLQHLTHSARIVRGSCRLYRRRHWGSDIDAHWYLLARVRVPAGGTPRLGSNRGQLDRVTIPGRGLGRSDWAVDGYGLQLHEGLRDDGSGRGGLLPRLLFDLFLHRQVHTADCHWGGGHSRTAALHLIHRGLEMCLFVNGLINLCPLCGLGISD